MKAIFILIILVLLFVALIAVSHKVTYSTLPF